MASGTEATDVVREPVCAYGCEEDAEGVLVRVRVNPN